MIFAANGTTAQQTRYQFHPHKKCLCLVAANYSLGTTNHCAALHQTHYKKKTPVIVTSAAVMWLNPILPAVITADFYTRNFGFFCKKELQFERATKLPLKVRVGSLQYVDYLEGKPNSAIHYYK